MKNLTVKVSVSGGVLSIDELPYGVEVEVTENDNGEVFTGKINPKIGNLKNIITSRIARAIEKSG